MKKTTSLDFLSNSPTKDGVHGGWLRLFWTFIAGFALLLPYSLHSQTAYILWQDKAGSATAYIDDTKHVGYLVDGGKSGTLTIPRIENKTILGLLLDKHCEHLVVVCSHPHEDHAGGFKDMIDNDSDLLKFKSIRFVDSGYPEPETLFARFTSKQPTYPAQNVSHISALGKNAFAEISSENDAVYIRNFEYVPETGARAHGNSIISQIVLQKDGQRTLIVDFDDADSALVTKWANWAKQDVTTRRPDVVIAPHHCSDGTEIEPLLDASIRPKSCVVTVNLQNRYRHPGPIMFNKWIKFLGVNAVHISGAEEDSIRFTESGLLPIDDKGVLKRISDEVVSPEVQYYKERNGDFRQRAALANTVLLYRSAIGTEGNKSSEVATQPISIADAPIAPPIVNSELEGFRQNIGNWIVTQNGSGKLFIHQSRSGIYLNNLMYTAESSGGKWRVSRASGEYIGEIDSPQYISIGSCSCQ